MSIMKRALSGFLSLILIGSVALGVVPTVEVSAAESISNVKIYAEKAQEEINPNITKVVDASKQSWDIEIWHYSGGYWGNNSVRINDSNWTKTEGGVADLHSALVVEEQTFTYNVASGSELETAIKEGRNVYINLSSGDSNIALSSLYDIKTEFNEATEQYEMVTNADGTLLATDATARIVKENGKYAIKVSVKPILNYYTEDQLSYTRDYDIALSKWVPFVANGFGFQTYSIFGGGFSAGYAKGWVNQKNPHSMEGMPAGCIHPDMISSPDGHLKSGYTITVNGKSADSGKIRIGDYTFRYAGAVGMHFVFPVSVDVYVDGAPAKVVTSYVELAGVNADGSPIFKQLKTEVAEAELDEKGTVKVDNVKEIEDGTGYLNDIFTSPIDMSEEIKSLSWEDALPTTKSLNISPNAEDIWSYNLSIRFGLLTQIDDIVNGKNSASYQQLNRVQKEYMAYVNQYLNAPNAAAKEAVLKQLDKSLYLAIKMTGIESELNKENSETLQRAKTLATFGAINAQSLLEAVYIEDLDNVILWPLSSRPGFEAYTVKNRLAIRDNVDEVGMGPTTSVTIGSNVNADGEEEVTTLYLRYVVIPERKMRHFIRIYKDNVLVETEIRTVDIPVEESGDGSYEGGTVDIPDLEEGIEFQKWATSDDLPLLEDMPTNPIQEGTNRTNIELAPNENIYVEWEKRTETPPVESDNLTVDQWRLSKYTDNLGWLTQAYMGLKLKADNGHASSTLSPSGTYSYKTLNPNGLVTASSYDPTNYNYKNYLHSKALTRGTYSVTHSSPSASVDMTGNLNLIKGTDTFGIKAASWLTSSETKTGLSQHNISTAVLPGAYTGESWVEKSDALKFGILNNSTYTHNYGVRYHYTCHHTDSDGDHSGCHNVCACYTLPETISPKSSKVTYLTADYDVNSKFDRYITKGSDKLEVEPEMTIENGKTTVSYQIDTELKVYPEVAMLFDNDKGESSIKWVVGDQARIINPVMFHSLQFKVFVDEQSNASSFATDTRALTTARSMGLGNLQVAYKGTALNTTFRVQRSAEDKDKMGILTVKTFALDLNTNKNGVNLKNSWSAGSYKPADYHNKFLTLWNGFKGQSTEKLEIDAGRIYTGAEKHQNFALSVLKYNGKTVTEFTHELIVRGGSVIGVKLQDRNTGAYSVVGIDALKEKDAGLYEALVGMKLVDESKDKTVFKGFEHQTGAKLSEQKYLTLVNQAKKSLDGLVTDNLALNKGWYSEDTTVLVIKEYVTNYNVPSVSYSDKISMTVPGLETPANKAQFFSVMGKGHTYLKYRISGIDLSSVSAGLTKKAEVYFEHSSRTGSPFGKMNVDYLVPNVSITDTTRMN